MRRILKNMFGIFDDSPIEGSESLSYSSFKAHNSSSKLRTISSNIIHHPEGRSELRGALTCEIGLKRGRVKLYIETKFIRDMIVVENKKELIEFIKQRIKDQGPNCDLNDIDVSNITDMSFLFIDSEFDGDISSWNVSNVKDMSFMFCYSKFDGDISKWDVSNVEGMNCMFESSRFNGDISKWNVSNVKDMSFMFKDSVFTGDISSWDVSNAGYMSFMFTNSRFNGDISKWSTSNVVDVYCMFYNSPLYGHEPKWYRSRYEV